MKRRKKAASRRLTDEQRRAAITAMRERGRCGQCRLSQLLPLDPVGKKCPRCGADLTLATTFA